MRIAICEYDPIYIDTIRCYIDRWKIQKGIHNVVVVSYRSTEDLLELLEQQQFDLLFLDIMIPNEMNGFELAKKVRSLDPIVDIVFVTNDTDYATLGYKVRALRYITKPFSTEQIYDALDATYHKTVFDFTNKIAFPLKEGIASLSYHSILYVEADAHYSILVRADNEEKLHIRAPFSQMCKWLAQGPFLQTHRSYLINLMYAEKIRNQQIHLSGGYTVPIGIRFKEKVEKIYASYYPISN